MSDPQKPQPPSDDPSVRPHVYDGIEEFNNRLPNWWLMTLYITIAFSIGYWFYYAQSGVPMSDGAKLDQELARIEAAKLSSSVALDDDSLWKMSRNELFTAAGKSTYDSTCASCHGPALAGGIGPNLLDAEWIHGAEPMKVYQTVADGVLVKGMPAWAPVLGTKKVSEVVAFILSKHEPKR